MNAIGQDQDTIRGIEERAFNAWPALETVLAGGWVLRFAQGYTKRANSVNAWHPTLDVGAICDFAGPLYRARGLPLVVRLSPLAGPDTDAALAGLGYRSLDETIVMTAPIGLGVRRDADVAISDTLAQEWADGFAAANHVPPARRAVHDCMLQAILCPVAFASLEGTGGPLAFGLAVAERGMVGLFDIVTRQDVRRQGAARRLVASLLGWGRFQGAGVAYLQVLASNQPAIALYRGLGFSEAYRYHYRVAPA